MTGVDPRPEVARVLASRPEFIVLDDVEPLPAWGRDMLATLGREYRSFHAEGSVRVLRRVAAQPR